MATITFFRQRRRDGGLHTGVDVGNDTVLRRFVAGKAESDPTLLWYVDVSADGSGVPATAEAAREWLAEHAAEVRTLLEQLATDVRAGTDPDANPVQRQVVLNVGGHRRVKLTVSAAFVNRGEAAKLPRTIRQIGDRWAEYVGDLVATA